MGKLSHNVLRETPKEVLLSCGHTTTGPVVAMFPNRKRMFDCPKGCGLVKAKR